MNCPICGSPTARIVTHAAIRHPELSDEAVREMRRAELASWAAVPGVRRLSRRERLAALPVRASVWILERFIR